MKAMVLNKICSIAENKTPLELVNLPDPVPGEKEILVKVSACGVCHTELDEIEGRTPPPRFPVVPGHQVEGRVEKTGSRNSH
jgi:propanol-preferring alcohol dehydrogenase